jgi:hypothetical protein
MPAEIHNRHDSDGILLKTKEDAVGKIPKHCFNNSVKRLHHLPNVAIIKPGALFPVKVGRIAHIPPGISRQSYARGHIH